MPSHDRHSLYGICAVQVYQYFTTYKQDPIPQKLAVSLRVHLTDACSYYEIIEVCALW